MATNNRGGNRGGSRSKRGRNNNPQGHNQYSSGWMDTRARAARCTAAAAVGGAVAAGVFLWSRRNQISDQIGNLSDQISEWREGSSSTTSDGHRNRHRELHGQLDPEPPRQRKSQSDIAEEALTLKETGKATA